MKRVAERAHLAGCGAAGGGASGQPLDVPNAVERLAQPCTTATVLDRHFHRVEPGVDGGRIAERREQPLAEQPAPHRGHRRIDHLEEGAAARAGSERLDQLEVAAGHVVEPEEGVGAADEGTSEMGKAGRLQLAEVAEQGAGGAECGRIVGSETETVERGEREAAAQLLAREIRVEFPCARARR